MDRTVAHYLSMSSQAVTEALGGADVLLHSGVQELGPDGAPAHGFSTQAVSRDARALELATGLAMRPFLLVTPIVKRPDAAFPERIGVGRTRNTDICFPHPKISKFHAYFSKAEDGTIAVVDVDSKNGTFVDKSPILPRQPYTLNDRTIISFARYHVRFHTSDGFSRALEPLR